MPRTVRNASTLAAATLAALIIAACTDTQSPPSTPGLSQSQAQAVGDVVANDIAALPEGMSFSGSGSGLLAQLAAYDGENVRMTVLVYRSRVCCVMLDESAKHLIASMVGKDRLIILPDEADNPPEARKKI